MSAGPALPTRSGLRAKQAASIREEATVKAVHCPCGEVIEAETDDELVEKTKQHVRDDHPELVTEYTREKILSIAHDH
jgi:predicted small metal-binding protein